MSANSSDSEAEPGYANARAGRPSLAALHAQNLEALVHEPNWHDTEPPDFHRRFVAKHHRIDAGSRPESQSSRSRISDTSSMDMAVSIHNGAPSALGGSARSRYSSSGYAPSLVSHSTIRSNSSMQTGLAEGLLYPYNLETGDDGALRLPPDRPRRLACLFHFLTCKRTFDDHSDWDTHCRSHFNNRLPEVASCPFYCDREFTGDTPYDAWEQRIDHIVTQHRSQPFEPERRPEQSLIEHLWQHRIITVDQYRELNLNGMLRDDRVFATSEGRNLDRRRRRRP